MKNAILFFFLLVLRILFNVSPDTSHKQNRFSKTPLKKSLKFILYKSNSFVAFILTFFLLLVEINLVFEEHNYKKERVCSL